jgi:pyruvate-formate lyase
LIQLLTDSNQSLINQARTTELASLAGLNQMTGTGIAEDDSYISTDAREMAVWRQMVANQAPEYGEEINYTDELAEMRGDL